MKKYITNPDPNIWLILALSIFAWAPLLTPAYFLNAHDARHSIFFLVEFDQTLRDGYLWPRWSPDFSFGYGYPLFNLYAPLSFYAAEILHLGGLSFTTAVKTIYILATIGAGLSMYGFVRSLFGRRAGLLATVAYMYAPFHLVEIFVRSAFAEFVALALVPLVFWAFTRLVAAPGPRRLALAGLAYGALALVHHTSFFTFSPLLIVYVLYLIGASVKGSTFQMRPPGPPKGGVRHEIPPAGGVGGPLVAHHSNWFAYLKGIGAKERPFKQLAFRALAAAAAGLLGLGLAAIYLLPAIAETRFVKVEQWTSGSYNYFQHFVYFAQFVSPRWGYGYSGQGLQDDFSFQLGIVLLALMAFALINLIARRFAHRGTALFFLIATGLLLLAMSTSAEPIWRLIPIATLVQFPWRLLAVTAFTMSVTAASLLGQINEQLVNNNDQTLTPNSQSSIHNSQFTIHNSRSAIHLLLLVIILASFPYTLPQYTRVPAWAETPLAVINWDRGSIKDRVGMVSVSQEQPQTSPMEPEYLDLGRPATVAGIIAGQGTVETLHHGGASDAVKVTAAGPVTLQFFTYHYPGWQVSLEGQPLAHRPEPPYGLITVDLPPGEHTVQLQMGSTPPRTAGAILSGLALLVAVGLLFGFGVNVQVKHPE